MNTIDIDTKTNDMTDIVDSIDMNEFDEPNEMTDIEVFPPRGSDSIEMFPDENHNMNEKEDVDIENKTSSQQTLNDYLKDADDDIEYIHLDKNMYGVLDLSVISINHKNVKHIYFGEGNITEIINFPESLIKFECAKNLLSSLRDLPRGIIEIDVSHNMITTIDLKELTMLQKLRCSWNRLTCLNELPDSLIEIIVDNNSITEIDLSGLVNLERVDCANNSGIIVKNVPTGVVLDIDMNGGAKKVDDKNKPDISYDEVMKKYFLWKNNYENSISVVKKKNPNKKANEIEVNCVNCKKNGGMTFEIIKGIYYAKCNTPKKCFEICIQPKSSRNLEESMNNSKKIVEKSREDIIKQKMDTLFGYIQEEESSKAFLKNAEEYTKKNLKYEEHLKEFNDIFHNTERDDSIQKEEVKLNKFEEEMDEIDNDLKLSTDNEIREGLIKGLVEKQSELSKKCE